MGRHATAPADFAAAWLIFTEAARGVQAAWEAERDDAVPEVENYPAYLPSFDEFVVDLLGVEAVGGKCPDCGQSTTAQPNGERCCLACYWQEGGD